jgi:hypothetical protein
MWEGFNPMTSKSRVATSATGPKIGDLEKNQIDTDIKSVATETGDRPLTIKRGGCYGLNRRVKLRDPG